MTVAVGIDFGNDKCVVAISRDGVVDAVLNEESKRETRTVVQFHENHRLFGGACTNLKPKSTITQLKRLIANEDFKTDLDLLPYETVMGTHVGIVVKVRYLNLDLDFTGAEMLGMLLGHVKLVVERMVGSKISTCVIGFPEYLNERQRKAYSAAAEIAGLEPLGLLSDADAAAIEYASYRTFPHGPATHVVFVDVGHCDTQVTVARFMYRRIEVLGRASDRNLGGRNFDGVIFQYLLEQLMAQHGRDVRSNDKAKARAWMACEKAKRVLSANKEATISIDCLMGDIDFRGVISREEFVRKSSDLLERTVDICRKALVNARLSRHDVRSVELVGSGSRIPAISDRLSGFFGLEMSRTLNGSEFVARGCALLCEKLILDDESRVRSAKRKRGTYLSMAQAREKKLLDYDRASERAKAARNDLEACIIDTHNKLRKQSIKNKNSDELSSKLKEIEDWLNDIENDESEEVFKAKIQELKSVLDIYNENNQPRSGGASSHGVRIVSPRISGDNRIPSTKDEDILCISRQYDWDWDVQTLPLLSAEDYKKEESKSPKYNWLRWILIPCNWLRSLLQNMKDFWSYFRLLFKRNDMSGGNNGQGGDSRRHLLQNRDSPTSKDPI